MERESSDTDIPRVNNNVVKLLVIGDCGCGKTCFLFRWADDGFNTVHITTIGVDFKDRVVRIRNRNYDVEIWDSAGQERFDAVTLTFYRRSEGIIVMFDLSSMASFKSLPKWFNKIKDHAQIDVPLLLVGNKCDQPRAVPRSSAESVAKEQHAIYFETSSKVNENVDEAVMALLDKVMDRRRGNENSRKSRRNLKSRSFSLGRKSRDDVDDARPSRMGSFAGSQTASWTTRNGEKSRKKKRCVIL